ncbi:NAD(P)H-dependent oxidoreductase [Flavobacterium subsaxonicum]|uniref:NADPH-quinone reductase n=1 Tax=Flavobacterium subsaxonicum WB 4.1-42 = DSM 21790 TaxID=1121898 RepID=A0A0A2MRW1_9FLAO|nr:NAD(P)H-dependent oxidoreductase [Flavobacterium subsaxonicum]KGO95079.1 NADPH-quinone reductase [Flavobacterium subsaxonicum WB 4.1-42 = DSM 21790]
MNVYILLAHPEKQSFNGQIANEYENAARLAGHVVRRQNLGDMDFDPILWKGYAVVQELEPDLKMAQSNILWCNHWVIIYPVWWGSVPALLKGFFDRTLLPGFAFRHHTKGSLWDKLLKGRSAHLITTSDAPWWWLYFSYRNSDLNTVKRAIFYYCGITPVTHTRVGRVRFLDEDMRRQKISKLLKNINSMI